MAGDDGSPLPVSAITLVTQCEQTASQFIMNMDRIKHPLRLCLALAQLSMASLAISQTSSQPVFERVYIVHVLWGDTLQAMKLERAYDGVDSVRNMLTDSGLVRHEFDTWGRLLRRVKIVQIDGVDTTYTENLTTGEMEIEVSKGITDIPNGYFQEYNGAFYPYRSGSVEMGRPVGLWRYFGDSGLLVKTMNIGQYGWPDGECIEYHLNGSRHWEGNYGIRKISALECPACRPGVPGFGQRHTRSVCVPIGEWKEWNDSGELIQVVKYSRIED